MKKVYYSWSQIEGACLDIARQLQQDNWRPDYIVGITRGGAVPAVLLSQYMGIPMRPLQVSLRDGGDCVSDLGMAEDAFGCVPNEIRESTGTFVDPAYRKKILIVDSTGVYPKKYRPDILLLRQSPKINLDRLIQTIHPKVIIADASNYKTVQKHWETSCVKAKIPFHSTSEKGFYILN
jgi:hypothetical protein